MDYLEMMKSIHENILQFLDDEENKYDDALNDERIKIFQRNQFDKQELKSILYLISKISENHHRNSSFFEKINTIINLLKNQITQTFSNIEIFDYFKQNKMILLLLIKDNILTFDSNVSNRIEEIQYQPFFYTELNKLNVKLSEKENPENYENYEEKRFKGENDSYLCEIIRNDIIEEFTFYFTKGEFSLSDLIEPSIYESNAFLIGKRQSLIEYSAFFGSIQIFRFLIQNGVKLLPSLWLYSIHGRNPDMIHLLEENHVYPSDNTYQECLEESIKCHHNELAFYFINNFIDENDFHSNYKKNEIYYGFHYYNFEFIPIELKEPLKLAFEKDNYDIYNYLINYSKIEICANCFKNCEKLKEFVVPISATFIGDYAFYGCQLLSDITIPSSVTSLRQHCFEGCACLKRIQLPSTLESIGEFSFKGCTNLIKIDIPPLVTSIEEGTFSGCSSLKTINIPESVTSIGFQAFYGCELLDYIKLPSSINKISSGSFNECTSLKGIIYKNDLDNIEIIKDIPKRLRMCFAGDTNSGKTCFLNRILEDVFYENLLSTISPSSTEIRIIFQGKEMKILIWDTSGQLKFHSLSALFYRDSAAAAIFFDINRPESFNTVKYFIEEIYDSSGKIPLVIIGNKCDLNHNVNENDINELAQKYNAKYFEVSCKNNINIEESFNYLIDEMIKANYEKEKKRILNLFCKKKKKCQIY